MTVLSNIAQPNVSVHASDGYQHPMFDRFNSSRRQGAGFTLLQGHIQLMAMVPNLPENLTSPRCGSQTNSCEKANVNNMPRYDYAPSQITDTQSFSITPRTMPSAAKFCRPHLPSLFAGKSSQSILSSTTVSQPPRSLSNLSLPPKPSQPITMPSFAKCLPGTKRFAGHMASASSVGGHLATPQLLTTNSSSFPIIPAQPSYQTSEMFKSENQYQQQQQCVQNPATSALLNSYTGAWLSPQMAYQMVNVVPSHHQQQYDFTVGAGDNSMASVLQQIQQQQNFSGLAYPYQRYPQQFLTNELFHYSHQTPYAVQSMPCFGTSGTTQTNMPSCTTQNFTMSPTMAPAKVAVGASGLLIPPVSNNSLPQPVYSASMPEICFTTLPSHQSSIQHREHAPLYFQRVKRAIAPKKGTSKSCKKEIAIVVQDSTSSSSISSTSSSSSSSSTFSKEDKVMMKRSGAPNKSCKSISVLKLRMVQKEKQEKKAKEEARYASLGPESDPRKIPSIPRVAHTPILIKPHSQEDTNTENDEKQDEKCGDGCYCSRCKCCMSKNEGSCTQQQPQNLEEKVKELKEKLTPRKKGKQVVVAVHECFPSDSSVTEADSDVESPRRNLFNYTTGNNGAVVRKRKPRIDTILKSRIKGDSADVFDDLDLDLNPDEARTFTCDYLVELLSSDDWNNCYTALQAIVRLARHRPKVLLNYLSGPILWCTFHHITSPKSALCRAAIVTFKELFQKIGSALDNDLEKIMEKLVLKSLAPNMFIREECDRALEAMVANCNLVKVLIAMESTSKKAHVRTAGHRLARMALQIVQVAGVDMCLKPMYAEKLLPMLFCFMTQPNNETRTAAKEALAMLMNHLQFETAVKRHVTFDKNCTEVFKKLDKMRGRNRNRRQIGNVRYPLPHAKR